LTSHPFECQPTSDAYGPDMNSVLFIDYATTVKLLSVSRAMQICEDVFAMHARGSV